MVRRVGVTTDFESVRSALDAVTVVGDTSLRDALFLALHAAAPEATRPLLLIFTDGADTSGLLLADEMLESVRDANLVTLGQHHHFATSSAARCRIATRFWARRFHRLMLGSTIGRSAP